MDGCGGPFRGLRTLFILSTVMFFMSSVPVTAQVVDIRPLSSHHIGHVFVYMSVSSCSGCVVKYTTDGSSPTASSPTYTGPLKLTSSASLVSAAFTGGVSVGSPAMASYQVSTPAGQLVLGSSCSWNPRGIPAPFCPFLEQFSPRIGDFSPLVNLSMVVDPIRLLSGLDLRPLRSHYVSSYPLASAFSASRSHAVAVQDGVPRFYGYCGFGLLGEAGDETGCLALGPNITVLSRPFPNSTLGLLEDQPYRRSSDSGSHYHLGAPYSTNSSFLESTGAQSPSLPSDQPVSLVATSPSSTVAVFDGTVYTSGFCGVLGRPCNNLPGNNFTSTFEPIPRFEDTDGSSLLFSSVDSVAASESMTAIVADGKLFTTGICSSMSSIKHDIALGRKCLPDDVVPRRVEGELASRYVTDVAITDEELSAVFVVADGMLFGFGTCYSHLMPVPGATCNNDTSVGANEAVIMPVHIPVVNSEGVAATVTQISAGSYHLAILADGVVYTLGLCDFGALGRHCEQADLVARPVDHLWDGSANRISATAHTTYVLSESGEAKAFGGFCRSEIPFAPANIGELGFSLNCSFGHPDRYRPHTLLISGILDVTSGPGATALILEPAGEIKFPVTHVHVEHDMSQFLSMHKLSIQRVGGSRGGVLARLWSLEMAPPANDWILGQMPEGSLPAYASQEFVGANPVFQWEDGETGEKDVWISALNLTSLPHDHVGPLPNFTFMLAIGAVVNGARASDSQFMLVTITYKESPGHTVPPFIPRPHAPTLTPFLIHTLPSPPERVFNQTNDPSPQAVTRYTTYSSRGVGVETLNYCPSVTEQSPEFPPDGVVPTPGFFALCAATFVDHVSSRMAAVHFISLSAGEAISAEPPSFSISHAFTSQVSTHTVLVVTIGGWELVPSSVPEWITGVEPMSGFNTTYVTFIMNQTLVPDDDETADIQFITTLTNSVPEKVASVSINVKLEPPSISVNPTLIEQYVPTSSVKEDTIKIENTGVGVLRWDAVLSLGSSPPPWASIIKASGPQKVLPGESQTLTIRADTTGLEPGTYTTQLVLFTTDSASSDIRIPWILRVTSLIVFPLDASETLAPDESASVNFVAVNMRSETLKVFFTASTSDESSLASPGNATASAPWLSLPLAGTFVDVDPLSTISFQALVAYRKTSVRGGPGMHVTGFRLFVFNETDTPPVVDGLVDTTTAIDFRAVSVGLEAVEGSADALTSKVFPVTVFSEAEARGGSERGSESLAVGDPEGAWIASDGVLTSQYEAPVSFVLVARDVFGVPRSTGGDSFLVNVLPSADDGTAVLRDLDNGNYTIDVVGRALKDVFVSVTHRGSHVLGSPIRLRVVSPECNNATSQLDESRTFCICKPTFGLDVTSDGKVVDSCSPCPAGTFSASASLAVCTPCPSNAYSTGGASACTPCPDDGVSCLNGILEFQDGFWIEHIGSKVDSSTRMHECPVSSLCDWGANDTFACTDAHKGPMCMNCLPDHALVGEQCFRCWPKVLSWGVTILLASILVVLLVVLIRRSGSKRSVTMGVVRILVNWLQASALLASFEARGPELVSRMLAGANVGDGLSLNFFPLQCALDWGYYGQFYAYLSLPILAVLVPALVMTVWFVYHRGWLWCKPRHVVSSSPRSAVRSTSLSQSIRFSGARASTPSAVVVGDWSAPASSARPSAARSGSASASASGSASASASGGHSPAGGGSDDEAETGFDVNAPSVTPSVLRKHAVARVMTSAVVLLFLLHNKTSKVLFTVFRPYKYDVYGKPVLQTNFEVVAEGAKYNVAVLFGVLGALFYSAGIPLLAVWILWSNRHRLDAPDFREKFAFLYEGYQLTRGRYLWEAIVLCRKIGIIIIVVTVSEPFYQAYSAIILVTLFLCLQIYVKPYESVLMNALDIASLLTLWGTLVLSLLYWRFGDLDGSDTHDTYVSAAILLLNITMLAVFLGVIVLSASPVVSQSLRRAKQSRQLAAFKSKAAPGRKFRSAPHMDASSVIAMSGSGSSRDMVLSVENPALVTPRRRGGPGSAVSDDLAGGGAGGGAGGAGGGIELTGRHAGLHVARVPRGRRVSRVGRMTTRQHPSRSSKSPRKSPRQSGGSPKPGTQEPMHSLALPPPAVRLLPGSSASASSSSSSPMASRSAALSPSSAHTVTAPPPRTVRRAGTSSASRPPTGLSPLRHVASQLPCPASPSSPVVVPTADVSGSPRRLEVLPPPSSGRKSRNRSRTTSADTAGSRSPVVAPEPHPAVHFNPMFQPSPPGSRASSSEADAPPPGLLSALSPPHPIRSATRQTSTDSCGSLSGSDHSPIGRVDGSRSDSGSGSGPGSVSGADPAPASPVSLTFDRTERLPSGSSSN